VSDPIILLGLSDVDQKPVAIGLYATKEDARKAVMSGHKPEGCTWCVVTPALGTMSWVRPNNHHDAFSLRVFMHESMPKDGD